MNISDKLLACTALLSIITCIGASSCLLGISGTCGCCNLTTTTTTTCIEIPYSILPFVTPNYVCIAKELAKRFTFTNCNCTLKDPALCLCFNRTQSFPIHTQCDSLAE